MARLLTTDGVQPSGASGTRPSGRAATGRDSPGQTRPGVSVLADRIAAALVQHEPGWRLPRRTALARRYHVTTAETEMAVGELVSRRLVRRLPDDQLYRSSPAEYLLPLEGIAGLGTRVDPMGGEVTCHTCHASCQRVPEHITCALGTQPGELAYVVQLVWTSDGEPAAISTTYLAAHFARSNAQVDTLPCDTRPGASPLIPRTADGSELGRVAAPGCRPGALTVEVQPPPVWVARRLRLTAGQPALLLTVRFDDTQQARPCAITAAVLRPDMFRIALESPPPPAGTGDAKLPVGWPFAVTGQGP